MPGGWLPDASVLPPRSLLVDNQFWAQATSGAELKMEFTPIFPVAANDEKKNPKMPKEMNTIYNMCVYIWFYLPHPTPHTATDNNEIRIAKKKNLFFQVLNPHPTQHHQMKTKKWQTEELYFSGIQPHTHPTDADNDEIKMPKKKDFWHFFSFFPPHPPHPHWMKLKMPKQE